MKKTSSFSKVLILMLVTAFMVSCGTSKKTTKAGKADFAGNYEWSIEGIPDGDQSGTMTIKKTETGYAGELEAMGMAIPLEELKVEGNKMTGLFYVQDMDISFSMTFEGEGFNGNIDVMGQGFPFNVKKIK